MDPQQASFGQVKGRLGLEDHEIDERFGLIEVSPREHIYAVLVDARVATRLANESMVVGRSSNPTLNGLDLG